MTIDIESVRPTPHSLREARKAVVASFLGGALEYFDFFIYGSAAALIFGRVFFAEAGPGAQLASLATFGVAYVARPIGAIVLGHFGDRLGRKRVLVWSLAMMGTATVAIGFIPDFASIGIAAPLLLILCRLIQGFSAGGETAGASTMVLEHAPAGKRGFYASWIQSGIVTGFVLATLVFLPISLLPEADLYSWGWRVPFWSSAILLLVTFIIRRSLSEPEVYRDQAPEQRRSPLLRLLREHPRQLLQLAGLTLYQAIFTLVMVFGLSFATATAKISPTTMLVLLLVMNVLSIGFHPLGGWLSDRIGRRPVFISAAIGCAVLGFPYFAAMSVGNLELLFILGILMNGIVYPLGNGVTPAYFSELFRTGVRFSGTAIGIQIGMIVSGFSPLLASAWVNGSPDRWPVIGALIASVCVIAIICAFTTKESHRASIRG